MTFEIPFIILYINNICFTNWKAKPKPNSKPKYNRYFFTKPDSVGESGQSPQIKLVRAVSSLWSKWRRLLQLS